MSEILKIEYPIINEKVEVDTSC